MEYTEHCRDEMMENITMLLKKLLTKCQKKKVQKRNRKYGKRKVEREHCVMEEIKDG